MGGDEVEGLDEEFLFHLGRGSDLLVRGELESARASLERARELRAKDAKVLGLLGQAYYKLSRFDEAASVWQRLVDDNPVEPTARVNLGLACLKARRYLDAVKQLEIALDLNPEHKKAMGYLGLALLESGEPRRAREWFVKTGSDQMVARCDRLIDGHRTGAEEEAPHRASPDDTPPPPQDATPGDAAETVDLTEAPSREAADPSEAPSLEPLRTPQPGELAAFRPGGASTALGAWAAARLVEPVSGEVFTIAPGALSVAVRGEVHVRLEGLFATQGRVSMAPETKRFRGRAIDKPFGEGASRMYRVAGDGTLLYRSRGRGFSALDLGPDAAYLREEVLFGFEDGIAFENGRVPSSISAELHLVHLRGRGRFLLATSGDPVSIDVTPGAPVKVPLAALVGWIGALTPRVCTLLDEGESAVAAVELTGEGRALADPGAAIAAAGAEG